jgi:radical SAM superfamily enzyme YgiQ (UPF0313 family)
MPKTSKMKVTLLVPPPLDGHPVADRLAGCARSLYSLPNVFELSAAAVIEKQGFDVSYVNMPINNLKEKSFNDFLKTDRSDIYAIYGVNLTKETDKTASKKIRAIHPSAHVIFYGPGPTYTPEDYLLNERTYVIRGEPEETLRDLTYALKNSLPLINVSGVTFRIDGVITATGFRPLIEDLDSLPYQALHVIGKEKMKYWSPKLGIRPIATMITSRNCPYNCSYCVPCSHSFARELEYRRHYGKKPPVRKRSAEHVMGEIDMIARMGYKAIAFQDDLFIMGKQRTIDICQGLEKYSLKWGCSTRADTIDEEVMKAMAESGCQYIGLGIESFDKKILKDIRKEMNTDCVKPAVEIIKKHGIRVKVNVLFGASQFESQKTISYSMKKVEDLKVDQVMYNIANPFPGTELYDIAKERGWFIRGDYYPSDVQKEAIVNLPLISGNNLLKAVKKGNRKFFLNMAFIKRNISNFANLVDFIYAFRSLVKKLQ